MTYTTRIAEAKSEAREEGIRQGMQQAKIETAKSMKSENMPVNTIARFTGLSPEEIEKLQEIGNRNQKLGISNDKVKKGAKKTF